MSLSPTSRTSYANPSLALTDLLSDAARRPHPTAFFELSIVPKTCTRAKLSIAVSGWLEQSGNRATIFVLFLSSFPWRCPLYSIAAVQSK